MLVYIQIERCNKVHTILIKLHITYHTFLMLLLNLCEALITALSICAKEMVSKLEFHLTQKMIEF